MSTDGTTSPIDNGLPSKDLGYQQSITDYIGSARKRYSNEHDYPSAETRSNNGQFVEQVFSELKVLDKPGNLEDARLTPGEYVDAISLLGWESVFKHRVSNDISPNLITDTDQLSTQAEKTFMAVCDRLFPDLQGRKTVKDSLELAGQILTEGQSDVASHLGEIAKVDSKGTDPQELAGNFWFLIGKLGDSMGLAIRSDEEGNETDGLKFVHIDQVNAMLKAAKAMYVLQSSRPTGLNEAEMVIAQNRASRTTVK